MIFSFFESFKYVGHLFPVVVLRMSLGGWFFTQAVTKYQGDFLLQPKLAAALSEFLPSSMAPDWYRQMADSLLIPHWQIFSYTLMYFEFLIGLSFIFGFLVRPFAVLGMVVAWCYLNMTSHEVSDFYQLQIVVFFVLGWLGAGRCLGIDYFFFKRQRGLLW
ncbi:MAG: DoxX family membrane protein [Bdellovibrionales bacterium]|nr:DoxX family membrane protein [Bdellovibrionales bacterium]